MRKLEQFTDWAIALSENYFEIEISDKSVIYRDAENCNDKLRTLERAADKLKHRDYCALYSKRDDTNHSWHFLCIKDQG